MMIVVILAAILVGVLASVLALVVVCVRVEDRRGELPHQAPSCPARIVRGLVGLRICSPEQASLERKPIRHNAPPRGDRRSQADVAPGATAKPVFRPTPRTLLAASAGTDWRQR